MEVGEPAAPAPTVLLDFLLDFLLDLLFGWFDLFFGRGLPDRLVLPLDPLAPPLLAELGPTFARR